MWIFLFKHSLSQFQTIGLERLEISSKHTHCWVISQLTKPEKIRPQEYDIKNIFPYLWPFSRCYILCEWELCGRKIDFETNGQKSAPKKIYSVKENYLLTWCQKRQSPERKIIIFGYFRTANSSYHFVLENISRKSGLWVWKVERKVEKLIIWFSAKEKNDQLTECSPRLHPPEALQLAQGVVVIWQEIHEIKRKLIDGSGEKK